MLISDLPSQSKQQEMKATQEEQQENSSSGDSTSQNKQILQQKPRNRTFKEKVSSLWNNTIQPMSINDVDGQKRIITVDFARGTSIAIMTFTHILDDMMAVDERFFERMPLRDKIILSPVIICGVIFCSMKFYFGYLSGISFDITFIEKMLMLTPQQSLKNTFTNLLKVIMAEPVMYGLGLLHSYNFHIPSHWFVNPAGKPFTNYTWCYCSPVYYAALTPLYGTVICGLVCTFVNMTHLSVQKKRFLLMHLLLLSGFCINWCSPFVRMAINKSMENRYGVKFDYLDESTDFIVQHWKSLPQGTSFAEIVRCFFYGHTAGQFMPIFPFLGAYLGGAAFGQILFMLRDVKISSNKPETRRKEKFNYFWKLYFYFMLLSCLNIPISFAIASWSHKQGYRHKVWDINDFPIYFDMRQELAAIQYPLSALCMLVPLSEFEMRKGFKKYSQNVLCLRRFGTYSLTIYVFEGIMRVIAAYHMLGRYPQLIGYQQMTDYWPIFEYYGTYLLVAYTLCILLDQIDGKLSVEWWLHKYAALFVSIKEKSIAGEHLNVKPVDLFN